MPEAAKDASTTSPWARYEPTEAAPWNRERVVHLHRRAAFAASWPQIERDLADGPDAATARLLAGQARIEMAPADFDDMVATIGDAAQASRSPARLQA